MPIVTTRTNQDCCIVALANYLGREYDEVLEACVLENAAVPGGKGRCWFSMLPRVIHRLTQQSASEEKGWPEEEIAIIRWTCGPRGIRGHCVVKMGQQMLDFDGELRPLPKRAYKKKHFRIGGQE